MDLSHVLWIGGPNASGSVGRALSRRFDLQLYAVDAQTRLHEPRMPITERWAEATPDELLDRFVTGSRHRFRLVLEDLAALPDERGVVVEGRQLFPTSVAAVLRAPEQALFLLPGPRTNLSELDLRFAAAVERDVRDLRLQHLRVDAPLDEMIERAAALLAPAVARLPGAQRRRR